MSTQRLRWLMRLIRIGSAFALAAAATFLPNTAAADTVASLLGDFTVNQYAELHLRPSSVGVHYVVVFGQLPALRELHLADTNGDGVTSQKERDAYVATLAPEFARQLVLAVDGASIPLKATHWTTSLPSEQGGFSLRLDIDYEAKSPRRDTGKPAQLRFENTNFAGRLGWHEIVVKASPELAVFETNAFDDSPTNGLADALRSLPSSGPLDERSIRLRYVGGVAPAGARPIASRGQATGSSPSTTLTDPSAPQGAWLQRQTKRLVTLISEPKATPTVMLLSLIAAMILGALHAFSPGHGKTIVGAYLIGSRSTPKHAIFLGITVTVTHTLVVFAVGLATLFASRFILPERLFPLLSLLSGVLVLGMGLVLLKQRWSVAHMAFARQVVRWLERRSEASAVVEPAPAARDVKPRRSMAPLRLAVTRPYGIRRPSVAHGHSARNGIHTHDRGQQHGHDHAHPHGPAHQHAAAPGGMHSHGGNPHSHLPPDRVSWRSLVALGVSGGLVPCPSAMVLLLAAVALNKTLYGLLMVVAFSVGLAMTLIVVGLVFLHARERFSGRLRTSDLMNVLPAISGVFITLVGIVLCYGALTAAGLGTVHVA